MRRLAVTALILTLLLGLATPALAWRVRVQPNLVVRVPALVIRPALVVLRPAPVVARRSTVVVVKPAPVCPRGWYWNDCRGRCLPTH